MEDTRPYTVPLMRVAPMFYKEKTFWETRLTTDEQIRDIGSVDNIDYNPRDLNELLVSSLARISMYDCNNLEIERTYKTNTQYQVYGGCFRKNDGRLIAAGSEEGKVFVFETRNTNPLRTFDLKAPTHRVLFMENKLIAFSDDLAVRILDVGSGDTIRTYGEASVKKNESSAFHQDYVRCGCVIDQLIVSGSYDHTVKLWDPRTDDFKPVMEYNHGHSVESFCTRGETLLISVGGNKLHVFDMVAGKTLTNIVPKHHKTITCVANYEDKYLLTGGLDGYLNVLDFNYEYVTRFDYDEAQILSLAVNPRLLAVGFNNHHIQVKRFKDFIKKSTDEMAELEKLQSGYFGPNMVTRYFHEAIAESQDPAATHRAMLAIKQKKTPVALDDVGGLYEPVVIPKFKQKNMSKRPIEKLLAGFHHSRALDAALNNQMDNPDAVIFVLQELMKRDKLKIAITGCRDVITLMEFISTQLSDIRHNRILLDSALILIEMMLNDRSLIQHDTLQYWSAVERMLKTISDELRVIDACAKIGAQLDTIISQY